MPLQTTTPKEGFGSRNWICTSDLKLMRLSSYFFSIRQLNIGTIPCCSQGDVLFALIAGRTGAPQTNHMFNVRMALNRTYNHRSLYVCNHTTYKRISAPYQMLRIRLLCFYLGYYTTIRLVGLSGHFLDYRNEITYHHCFREGIGSD